MGYCHFSPLTEFKMGRTVYYVFTECECLNASGGMDTIPAGMHAVAELDVVTVYVGSKVFDLNKNAFNLLKAQRKVTIPL
jgi:hypothetical protein